MKQTKRLIGDLETEQKKTTNRTTINPITYIDIQALTIWNILRRAIISSEKRPAVVQLKKETNLSSMIRLTTMHGTFPQNMYVVTYIFVPSDIYFSILTKIRFTKNHSELLDYVAIKFRFRETFLQTCFQTSIVFGHLFRNTVIKLRSHRIIISFTGITTFINFVTYIWN